MLHPQQTFDSFIPGRANEFGHGAARGLTAVDWDRRGGAADNARILLDYDPAAFEARVRAALAAG